MQWHDHKKLESTHAFLGASQHAWINYSEDKLRTVYTNKIAAKRGTELHDIAAKLIKHDIRQKRIKSTFNMYVNDAIGFKMKPEQVLFYSENCYGTADAISFKDGFLRIHDLKTGTTPASMVQLYIYAALFCLEYKYKPGEIQMETRIYQNDTVIVDRPTAETILPIMDTIIRYDRIIDELKNEMED